jgi:uncharacterized protein
MYAIVTGASNGLGKSFAFELASNKINLILIDLNGTGLPRLSAFIRRNFDVDVVHFEMDLTQVANYDFMFQKLVCKDVQASILINNAGIGNWSLFREKTNTFYKTQIELNVLAPVLLARLFLEQINHQRPSYILNVGSLGGTFIVPRKQVYGATKSFISYFTKCLRFELSNTNTRVCLLSAGGINTKPELLILNHSLKGISKATILEPEVVAKYAIRGLLKGKKEIVPGGVNKLLVQLNYLLPPFFKEYLLKIQLRSVINQKTIL